MTIANAAASAQSKLTKAQLLELVAQLEATTAAQSEQLAGFADQAAEQAEAPADFMLTGYLRSVTPVTTKAGKPVNDSLTADGFYKVSVDVTAGVNFGTRDAANWQNITAKTAWFTTDGAVAAQLLELRKTNAWTAVRVWYRLQSNAGNVIDVAQKDYKTGKQRVGADGQPLTERTLKHAADMRIAQVDVVAAGERETADDGYGAF